MKSTTLTFLALAAALLPASANPQVAAQLREAGELAAGTRDVPEITAAVARYEREGSTDALLAALEAINGRLRGARAAGDRAHRMQRIGGNSGGQPIQKATPKRGLEGAGGLGGSR